MMTFLLICCGIVGYTYVGYPVLVALMARRRAIEQPNGSPTGKVSVVLVVRNEEQRIAARIGNLLSQEPKGIVDEIVVVSDASDDRTDDIVEQCAQNDQRIRLIRLPRPQGKAAGVNAGVQASRNEIVAFADARQSFRPETIARLLVRFSDPAVGGVAGELRFRKSGVKGQVSESIGIYWKYELWIRQSEARIDSVIGCPGSVYAVRRQLFRPMPEGIILDDVWVPMHIILQGSRIAYQNSAVAEDDVSKNLEDEFRRKVRTLAGNVQLVMNEPRMASPFHNRLWWMFVSHKLLRLVVPYALMGALFVVMIRPSLGHWIPLVSQLLFYGVGLVGAVLGKYQRNACRICGAVKLFLGINVAAVLGTAYALSGRSHSLWRTSALASRR